MGSLSQHDQAMTAAAFIAAYGFIGWVYMTVILTGNRDRTPKDMLGEHATRRRIAAYIVGNIAYVAVTVFMLLATGLGVTDIWEGALEWKQAGPTGWLFWGMFMVYLAFPAYSVFTLFWIARRRSQSMPKV